MITLARLQQVLNYNSQSGVLTWNINIGTRARSGNVAGTLSKDGYLLVKIDDKLYYSHVLIWFGMTGSWPENEIDYIKKHLGLYNTAKEAGDAYDLASKIYHGEFSID